MMSKVVLWKMWNMYCHSQPANSSISLLVLPKPRAADAQHLSPRGCAMPVHSAWKVQASTRKSLSKGSWARHADENWPWKHFRCKPKRYVTISDLQPLCETCFVNLEFAIPWTAHTQQKFYTSEKKIKSLYYFSLTPLLVLVLIFRVTRGKPHFLFPHQSSTFFWTEDNWAVSPRSSSLSLPMTREHRPKIMNKFFTPTFWAWEKDFFPAPSCKIIVISNTCLFLNKTNLKYTRAGLWIFSC